MAGSRMAPNRLADWLLLAKYPSMLSVTMAKMMAMIRIVRVILQKQEGEGRTDKREAI